MTYSQQSYRLWQLMTSKAGRSLGATDSYKFLATAAKETGVPYMRKQDHFRQFSSYDYSRMVIDSNRNSNMLPATQKRLKKVLYKASRDETERGGKELIKKMTKIQKKKPPRATVREIADRLYSRVEDPDADTLTEWIPSG